MNPPSENPYKAPLHHQNPDSPEQFFARLGHWSLTLSIVSLCCLLIPTPALIILGVTLAIPATMTGFISNRRHRNRPATIGFWIGVFVLCFLPHVVITGSHFLTGAAR
jgi:hypothetical protein